MECTEDRSSHLHSISSKPVMDQSWRFKCVPIGHPSWGPC